MFDDSIDLDEYIGYRFVNTSLSTSEEINGPDVGKCRAVNGSTRPRPRPRPRPRRRTVARKQKRGIRSGSAKARAHDEWTNYRVHEIMRLPF